MRINLTILSSYLFVAFIFLLSFSACKNRNSSTSSMGSEDNYNNMTLDTTYLTNAHDSSTHIGLTTDTTIMDSNRGRAILDSSRKK